MGPWTGLYVEKETLITIGAHAILQYSWMRVPTRIIVTYKQIQVAPASQAGSGGGGLGRPTVNEDHKVNFCCKGYHVIELDE